MKGLIKEVVERHYNDMSQGFMMVLAGYAQAAYSQQSAKLAGESSIYSNACTCIEGYNAE